MCGSELEMDAGTMPVVLSLTRAAAAQDESFRQRSSLPVAEWRILRVDQP
jgi:hypothetical protein